ncbi:MAG: pyridoxal kinase [Paracoccaceae bacterium]
MADARRAPVCLSIQSAVVAGHVGHGASAPALTLLGVEAMPLPTVLLSGHAATPGVEGRRLPGEEIAALGRGLVAAGALARADALLTGYLGTEAAALAVADLAAAHRAARPDALHLCDPVLGDDGPGLYLPVEVGAVYRERLLPLADVATPNVFELGWLTGLPVAGEAAIRRAAEALRAGLRPGGPRAVVVTSVEAEDGIGAMTVDGGGASLALGPKAPRRLNGAGDFVAAVILAETLAGRGPAEAAARAVAAASLLAAAAEAAGRDDLPVVGAATLWMAASGAARPLRPEGPTGEVLA